MARRLRTRESITMIKKMKMTITTQRQQKHDVDDDNNNVENNYNTVEQQRNNDNNNNNDDHDDNEDRVDHNYNNNQCAKHVQPVCFELMTPTTITVTSEDDDANCYHLSWDFERTTTITTTTSLTMVTIAAMK